jgi:ABC-type glutathione transport system ATPase component
MWCALQVMPTSYGQVLPPWFFLQPSYWRSSSGSSKHSNIKHSSSKSSKQQSSQTAAPLLPDCGSVNGEQEQPDTSSPYVQIVGLRRTFTNTDGSTRVAVEGLTMQLSAGRVTALLGHNGAGKTTTIHMLTGAVQATGFVRGQQCQCAHHPLLQLLTDN